MKNKLLCFTLICSLLLFLMGFQVYSSLYDFQSYTVKSNIEFISSNTFKGRLTGTKENQSITTYIKNEFKNRGLQPFNGEYTEPFVTFFPNKIEGNPQLIVLDKKGNTLKTYEYGKDYKEDLLNFRQNTVAFTKNDKVKFADSSFQVTKDTGSFMFFVPANNDLSFRSSFIKTASHNMYIMLTQSTLQDIKIQLDQNYTISCFIPFEIKETIAENVIGRIPGKNKTASPIVISAHFDHLGTDLAGNIYAGALDNASGISFVMEFIRYITSLGIPERDILFVGFNAEEFGCVGSNKFVTKHADLLQNSTVFNFDMIGSPSSAPLCIMGAKKDTQKTPLISSASSICDAQKIYYNYIFEDASDHEGFRKANIAAITFCDNDMSRIHTPMDKSAFIDTSSINRCFKVASKEIIKYAFLDNPLLLYYKKILIATFCFSALLIFLLRRNNKR